jgi:hypothetical protein
MTLEKDSVSLAASKLPAETPAETPADLASGPETALRGIMDVTGDMGDP